MRRRLSSISLYQAIVVLGKLLLILVAGVFFVVLFLLPIIATSLGAHNIPQGTLLWPNLQTAQQSAATSSNGNFNSSQTPQAQAMLTEGQNDITVANSIVTFTGVFVGLVTVAVATASFFGISELFKIRELRTKLESDVMETNENAQQVKDRLATVMQDFQNHFDKINEQTTDIENQLGQLDKRIDTESQKFIEAAFYYSEGTKFYRSGDNHHAIEFYLRALKLQPKNLSILERLGRAYSNLNDTDNAFQYFNEALAINSEDETVLRSLSLLYRSMEPQKAIEYLKSIVQKNPKAFEAWDFLGLCCRDRLIRNQELVKDQTLIDEAIAAHESALAIKKRPETEFYLGILLYFSPKGDKIRAKSLMLSAYNGTLQQEHDLRIRQVWKVLIHAGVPIVNDDKDETFSVIESLKEYITTQRIYVGVESHLRFLLEGTGHSDWMQAFMNIVNTWKES